MQFEIEKSVEFSTLNETTTIEEAEMITKSFEETYSFLHEEEKWGGKNLPKTKSCNEIENPPKRGRYAIPSSTVDSALNELKPDANFPKDKVKSSKREKYLTPSPDI
ncbi:hypothetical protein RF55_9554 [Lasius niger]|uniref:Uncharacterized protein n=1 Tax=Lasius niger TaxID=67767 RepID=A0A0J7KJR5_LASNI|nr:hypothetical protein RF55_9554 [Lasius niger]